MRISQKQLTVLFGVLFFVLNSIWAIPGTLALRYIVLFTGLVLSLVLIRQMDLPRRTIKNYLPIICLLGLFAWVGLHRLMITQSPEIMSVEIQTIWKRALLEGFLGMALGMVLAQPSNQFNKNIFTIILLGPILAFYLAQGLDLVHPGPKYWHYLVQEIDKNYIPKYQFVLFAIIAFAWIVFYLEREIKTMKAVKIIALIMALLLIANAIFLVNGKNGFVYMGCLILALMIRLLWKQAHQPRVIALVMSLSIAMFLFGFQHVKTNPVWENLFSDIEVARHTDEIQVWKNFSLEKLEPLKNRSGNTVIDTTYLRTAWLIEGLKLVPNYPLGYGLVQDSFKYIGQKEWPDSKLSHTHSGWLDILLGLGIPGFVLILIALIACIKKGIESDNFYAKSAIWVLPTISLAFLSSELSEKISFEVLIFYIAFYAGCSLPCRVKPSAELR